MLVIDADCHVIENDQTWEYLDPQDAHFKPQPVDNPDRPMWIIDGRARQRPFGTTPTGAPSEQLSGFSRTSFQTRSLSDIDARLAHMDELNVDIQVLYPTIYLTRITERPEVELALAKSYNRWMADVWAQSKGRLRWVAVPPLDSINQTPAILRHAKNNGAVGVFMRGFEGPRRLTDTYFDPLYNAALEYDLPIAIHAGCGNPAFAQLADGDAYARNKLPVISAFHSLIFNRTPQRFPDSASHSSKSPPTGSPTSSTTSTDASNAKDGPSPTTSSPKTKCTSPAKPTTTSPTSSSAPPKTTS